MGFPHRVAIVRPISRDGTDRRLAGIVCLALLANSTGAVNAQTTRPGTRPGTRGAGTSTIIQGGTVLTMGKQGTLSEGTVVIRGDRIGPVTPGIPPAGPGGRRGRVIDASGKYVTPGLIDAWTDLGLSTGGPSTGGGAAATAADAIDRFEKTPFEYALRQGVTAICVEPPGVRGIVGTAALLRLAGDADSAGDLKTPVCVVARLGVAGGGPLGRLGEVAALRKAFEDAKAYRESWETYQEELEQYIKDLKAGKTAKVEEARPAGPGPRTPAPEAEEPADGRRGRRPGPRPRPPRPRPPSDDSIEAYIDWMKAWEAYQLAELVDCCEEGHGDGEMPHDPVHGHDDGEGTGGEANGPGADAFADEPAGGGAPAAADKKEGDKGEAKKPTRPSFDVNMEVLVKALKRELPVRIEVHRPADILNVLEIVREFHLDATLEGAAGAGYVARDVAAAETPVILGRLIPSALFDNSATRDLSDENVARLSEAGVGLVIGSGWGNGNATHYLRHNAALAVARGLPPEKALEAITIRAARACGAEESIGSIETGKQADVVIWSGPPLASGSRVENVFVGGREVYRRRR